MIRHWQVISLLSCTPCISFALPAIEVEFSTSREWHVLEQPDEDSREKNGIQNTKYQLGFLVQPMHQIPWSTGIEIQYHKPNAKNINVDSISYYEFHWDNKYQFYSINQLGFYGRAKIILFSSGSYESSFDDETFSDKLEGRIQTTGGMGSLGVSYHTQIGLGFFAELGFGSRMLIWKDNEVNETYKTENKTEVRKLDDFSFVFNSTNFVMGLNYKI